MRASRRALPWVLATAALLGLALSAGAQDRASCDFCRMYVDESDAAWHAGGQRPDGRPLRFDTPKCMFRFHHERGGVHDAWVTGRLSRQHRPARRMFYVLGSEVRGPMGRDLVPVEGRAQAERFAREHGGDRVLAFDEVTRAIAASLFGGPHPHPRHAHR